MHHCLTVNISFKTEGRGETERDEEFFGETNV